MSTLTLLLLVLLFLWLFGAFPRAGAYNEGWGYGPMGIGGILLLVLIVLLLTHRLRL